MEIVLISTYELGRQPFGLASPAAWLRKRGHRVACFDLSRQSLNEETICAARLIAFYVPMHTATRLTLEWIEPVRTLNPGAELCAYGLYAPLAADSLRAAGVRHLLGGEFERTLADLVDSLGQKRESEEGAAEPKANFSLERLSFVVPDRSGLPPLGVYAHVVMPRGGHRIAGYTEASRGCKHLCRHCPIVPVYNGVFRIVDREVVLADIRQQVAAGASHITFGDPDFFNGPGHAVALVEALHREFPGLTYDVTIKVEHLLRLQHLLPVLRDTGCLFVTSAVESLNDEILRKLEKGHTRDDFFRVVDSTREAGLTLQPTFVSFTPWTTLDDYLDLLRQIRRLDLISAVAPIQLAIRLLLPAGSRLLDLDEIRSLVDPFDAKRLLYPWRHADSRVDALAETLQQLVANAEGNKLGRAATFEKIWQAAHEAAGRRPEALPLPAVPASPGVPHLNEPWYC